METDSTLYQLVGDHLPTGQTVDEYLSAARVRGDSWATISTSIFIETQVRVSYETLRKWHAKIEEENGS